ncbi:cobalt-precorrin 5A hydrolase [Chloroflexota bacterium]
MKEHTAIIAITRGGMKLGRELTGLLSESHLYLPVKFTDVQKAKVYPFEEPLAVVVEKVFVRYANLVLIMATGIAVRLLAHLVRDKYKDPAVVVMDERGQYVISLLSGHIGGANALAKKIASLTTAQPVITTASDVNNTIAVDLLGREFGWKIESKSNLIRVAATLVNGEDVGIYQDAGERDWWSNKKPLPANIHVFDNLESLQESSCSAMLIITDRELSEAEKTLLKRSVVYRPRSLVLGIGCNKGVSCSRIEEAITQVFIENRLSMQSIRNLATVDIKEKEKGLLEYIEKHELSLDLYPREALKQIDYPSSPSSFALNNVGVPAVCEPAALLSSNNGRLVVPKMKMKDITIAIARVSYAEKH